MSPARTSRSRAQRTARPAPRRPARRLVFEPHPALAAQTTPATQTARSRSRSQTHTTTSRLPQMSGKWVLAARPDTVDFRDFLYVTSLVEVPREKSLDDYRKLKIPILDQGRQGACSGFGLATVVHYLLRTRRPSGNPAAQRKERAFNARPVSPYMLYRMARRYDEWAGEADDGSSARGAMKGWHKHGVCAADLWQRRDDRGTSATLLTGPRALDALSRPLGSYFRVNHRDLVAMHAAITEVGILYATCWVHSGWDEVTGDGRIPFRRGHEGGHVFAIVAYDAEGFWIQNSWAADWGNGGFCHLTYDDWLQNGTDVWVGRLGAPVDLAARVTAAAATTGPATAGIKTPVSIAELRPHVISVGNNGVLRNSGILGTDAAAVDHLFTQDFPDLTRHWRKRRLLLYAHGGLVPEESALQRVQDYRNTLLDAEVYPLAFVWKSDYWTTLKDALEDAQRQRKPEGFLDRARDFMLDRLDDMLEPLARFGTGKLEWDEMKENAQDATRRRDGDTAGSNGDRLEGDGAARLAAHYIQQLAQQGVEIHVAGHSAGSIFMAPLVQLLATPGTIGAGDLSGQTGYGVPIKTCTMWAPACTVQLFRDCYLPAITSGQIGRFALFTLTDKVEQDDNCAGVYHKSLLYLVSHAFEKRMRNPLVPVVGRKGLDFAGEPILGMDWWITRTPDLRKLFQVLTDRAVAGAAEGRAVWIKSPNTFPEGSRTASAAAHHGDFDDDKATIKATLARILDVDQLPAKFTFRFPHTAAGNRDQRDAYNR